MITTTNKIEIEIYYLYGRNNVFNFLSRVDPAEKSGKKSLVGEAKNNFHNHFKHFTCFNINGFRAYASMYFKIILNIISNI